MVGSACRPIWQLWAGKAWPRYKQSVEARALSMRALTSDSRYGGSALTLPTVATTLSAATDAAPPMPFSCSTHDSTIASQPLLRSSPHKGDCHLRPNGFLVGNCKMRQ